MYSPIYRTTASAAARIVLATFAVSVLAGAARADDMAYVFCDGRPSVTAHADGLMTEDHAGPFGGVKYGPPKLQPIKIGNAGLRFCDAALADPQMTAPDLWMRKVSLLRARAMHHLAAGDATAALADLDAADAAASQPDFFAYKRSLKLGTDLVRAFALRQQGKQADAEALAMKAFASRPYDRHTIGAAMVAIGPNSDPKALDTLRRALARVEPEGTTAVYLAAYDAGRFDEALALRDGLVPPLDKNAGDLLPSDHDAKNHRSWELFWNEMSGETAYALAAQGKGAEARAELARARDHLAQLVATARKQDAADETLLVRDGGLMLDFWAKMVDWRIDVAEGRAVEVVAELDPKTLPVHGASVDLLRAIKTADPNAGAALDPNAEAAKLAEMRATQQKASVETLFALLPDAENWPVLPQYKPLKEDGWKWGHNFGDYDFRGDAGNPPESGGTIHFHGASCSRMVVEEFALLRAADMARRMHKDILVVDMADRLHVEQKRVYGRDMGQQEDGYQADTEVLFVDRDHMPEKYRGAGWRVLSADEVYASLRAAYPSKA